MEPGCPREGGQLTGCPRTRLCLSLSHHPAAPAWTHWSVYRGIHIGYKKNMFVFFSNEFETKYCSVFIYKKSLDLLSYKAIIQ